jgi:hypothetical protein
MEKPWRKAMKLFENDGKLMILAGHPLIYDVISTYFYMCVPIYICHLGVYAVYAPCRQSHVDSFRRK